MTPTATTVPTKKTVQARLESLGTGLLVLGRTITFTAAIVGIFKARRKGSA